MLCIPRSRVNADGEVIVAVGSALFLMETCISLSRLTDEREWDR